ncbi:MULTISPECIES: hypothetical protein [Sphingobacterium]|uniref:hypothetical protein n=1 Tax=Sphingobacterium TaxID=28453 RepID=UPI0028B046FB|nr:hypothetical protein [Sphingobacterium multivorum]
MISFANGIKAVNMNQNVSNSLIESIFPTNSKDLLIDVADALLESNIDREVLENIPVVSSIYNLYKSAVSISDRMFLKKILSFLSELENIEKEKISLYYQKINTDEKFKKKVGDKLMFILDRCEDDEKSKIVAKIFGAYICEKIEYSDFLNLARAIEFLSLDDIEHLLKSKYWDFSGDANLVNAGLVWQELTLGDEREDNLQFVIHMQLSQLGEKLKTILSD